MLILMSSDTPKLRHPADIMYLHHESNDIYQQMALKHSAVTFLIIYIIYILFSCKHTHRHMTIMLQSLYIKHNKQTTLHHLQTSGELALRWQMRTLTFNSVFTPVILVLVNFITFF